MKRPRTLRFETLAEATRDPSILPTGADSPARLRTAHACWSVADEVLPPPLAPACEGAAASLLEAVRGSGLVDEPSLDRGAVEAFAGGAAGALSPMSAFLGGVAAQEVLKACSRRFTPLHQFLYFDCAGAVPRPPPSAEERAPRGDRYDGTRAVLGDKAVASLGQLNYFVVGAGALGCEMLKCLALMGVGRAQAGGAVHVTDMDRIERSNLNRQFLFRPADVGKFKASCAAAAATAINPEVRIAAYDTAVGGEEGEAEAPPFDASFWDGLDGVANALDNVKARLFVDSMCVAHQLPLLESGTSGAKGNTQVVLPHRTESYGSSTDPAEPSIPVCTLKSFPYSIEHTLQWARDSFEGEFVAAPNHVNAWLGRADYFSSLAADAADELPAAIEAAHEALVARPNGAADCVGWALRRFDDWFVRSIRALLRQFPADHRTESGELFWSGTHRRPTPTPWDPELDEHRAFVAAAATLRGRTIGIPPFGAGELEAAIRDAAEARAAAAEEEDSGEEEVRVATTEAEAAEIASEPVPPAMRRRLDTMTSALAGEPGRAARAHTSRLGAVYSAVPESFEKDDDSNSHMDFIAAASNLRAACYGIPAATLAKSKLIAGRIVPAIATTTAAVVGLACLELLKLANGADELETHRNGFLNLALPLVAFSEPMPAEVYELPMGRTLPSGEREWTLWSRLRIESPTELSLGELVERLEAELGLEITMLEYRADTIYSFLAPPKRQKEWMQMAVHEVAAAAGGGEGGGERGAERSGRALLLQATCYDEDAEEDVPLPTVEYVVK